MKKGISAILATVLILVLTITIIGLSYSWSTGVFETISDSTDGLNEDNCGGYFMNSPLKSTLIKEYTFEEIEKLSGKSGYKLENFSTDQAIYILITNIIDEHRYVIEISNLSYNNEQLISLLIWGKCNLTEEEIKDNYRMILNKLEIETEFLDGVIFAENYRMSIG